jgi:cytochrome o ubiquinol oxidase subunit 2
VVLAPAGDIAIQQRDILFQSVVLMLIIILPVMALIVLFAWRYRSGNKDATYEPDWGHSVHLELVIWSAPLLIIICLGAITWAGTHLLDPYRPLDRLAAGTAVSAEEKPLVVNVVALDWKWLFIYPELGVGAVNELAAPVDRPIDFRISASSVMNSFYIPALAGQIYAMPGMRTQLHAVINEPGEYKGISANYSGAGFSGMYFTFHGMSDSDFDEWIAAAKNTGTTLDRSGYLELEKPSQNEPPRQFASVEPGLFEAIVNLCVDPARMCMNDMMAIDARGGLGLAGARNTLPLAADAKGGRRAVFGPAPAYVASICSSDDPAGLKASAAMGAPSALLLRDDIAGPRPPLLDRLAPAGASQS